MVLTVALAAAAVVAADWVPARWSSSNPKTLDLVSGTPVDCLLIEQTLWSPEFSAQAASRGITILGVVRDTANPDETARQAQRAKLTGIVVESGTRTSRPRSAERGCP